MLRLILDSLLRYASDETLSYVATVNVEMAQLLGVPSGRVWIGAAYVRKLVAKHELDAEHVMLAIESLDHAPIYLDRTDRVAAIGRDLMGRPYIVGLKPEPEQNRILISTVHRTNEKQLRRLERSGKRVR